MQIALLVTVIVIALLLAALTVAVSVWSYSFYRLSRKMDVAAEKLALISELIAVIGPLKEITRLGPDVQLVQEASKNALNAIADSLVKLNASIREFKAQIFSSAKNNYDEADESVRQREGRIQEIVERGVEREEAEERVDNEYLYKNIRFGTRG